MTTDLNHTSLIRAVAEESGHSQTVVGDVLRAALDIIGRTVAAGYVVRISNFGVWSRKVIKATHNPQTMQPAGPTASVRFRSLGRLAQAVKAGELNGTLRKAPKSY